jgi:hypothetical protein
MTIAGLTAGCRRVDEELDRRFGSPSTEMSEPARQHLEQCERCRKLCAWAETETFVSPPPPGLNATVRNKLRASLKPVSPRSPMWVIACQFGMVSVLLTLLAVGVMVLAGFDKMDASQLLGITTILAAGVTLLSFCLAWQITPGSLQRVSAFAAVAILAAGFFIGVVVLFPWHTPEPFVVRGLPCLGVGLGLAAPAAFLFWLVARRGARLGIGTLGGALGAMAGRSALVCFSSHVTGKRPSIFWFGMEASCSSQL